MLCAFEDYLNAVTFLSHDLNYLRMVI
jgi:hypothetical protein